MPYGLTTDGFVTKTIEVIREEINDSLRSLFGTSIDLSDGSALGQFVGIFAEREALVWELAEQCVSSQDPDAASGTFLDALCALTGTTREPATHSTLAVADGGLLLMGTVATLIPSGSRCEVGSTGAEFETTADATLIACTAWAGSTAYTLNQVRTNASRIYIVITAGTSAGAGGPTTTASDITDGTVHWKYLSEGAGVIAAPARAVETGPIVALAGDLTTITTPISGWLGAYNIFDADLGTDVETDEDLRLRREEELAAAGTATVDGITSALLDVDDVTAVRLFVNNTDTTDADGVPPHAIEALVQGGTNQDIFDALLANVAAGIATHGTTSGTAIDSTGVSHAMEFSRPTEIPIYIDIFVTKDASTYPSDGDTQIKEMIVAWGDAQSAGKDVVASAISAQAFRVTGVLDVTLVEIGTASNPTTSTTIAITLRQLATYDTGRITVTAVNGTP